MSKLLLKVEGVFFIKNDRVILLPGIVFEQKTPSSPITVTLKRPDGSSVVAEASFHIPHIQFAKIEHLLEHLKREKKHTCILKGVEKFDVPVGTEVWIDSI